MLNSLVDTVHTCVVAAVIITGDTVQWTEHAIAKQIIFLVKFCHRPLYLCIVMLFDVNMCQCHNENMHLFELLSSLKLSSSVDINPGRTMLNSLVVTMHICVIYAIVISGGIVRSTHHVLVNRNIILNVLRHRPLHLCIVMLFDIHTS